MTGAREKKHHTIRAKKHVAQYLFVLPALLFFTMALVIPFLLGLNIAFTDWNGITKDYNYVGFDNFLRMFNDIRILPLIKNTYTLAFIGVIANNTLTLGLALLTNNFKGKFGNACRMMIFIPCCLSCVLAAFSWKFIYRFVLSALFGWSSPLGSASWVIPGIVLIGLWNSSGINMLIYYAALKNVPDDVVEAAVVDGANRLQVFRHVTVPMIVPAFSICVTLNFTSLLKEFGTVMSATGGGPAGSSKTFTIFIYENLYTFNQAGYGQAIALVFLVLLIITGNLLTNFFRKREVEVK